MRLCVHPQRTPLPLPEGDKLARLSGHYIIPGSCEHGGLADRTTCCRVPLALIGHRVPLRAIPRRTGELNKLARIRGNKGQRPDRFAYSRALRAIPLGGK